jgi:hypothetical protein
MAQVAVIDVGLQMGAANRLIPMQGEARGWEDIWHDADEGRYYLLIECATDPKGVLRPVVETYDEAGKFVEALWFDFEAPSENKGFEGLALVRWGGEKLMLGICEGNKCEAGAKGRKGGGGRIQAFRHTAQRWEHAGTIKLPKSLDFADYASLDVQHGWIAVLSQEASAIWLGRFADGGWKLVDDGTVFDLPRDEQGKVIYCNAEGLSWIGDRTLMVVSDRRKASKQSERCGAKDQSVHIFRIPEE